MKRNQGFTLIELLVVMAIIAILASIVVPNIVSWIGRARMTRAQAEIQSIETALAKMLSDVGRNSLNDLLDPDKVRALLVAQVGAFPVHQGKATMSAAHFARIQSIYTNTFYALLRAGRNARTAVDPDFGFPYGDILRNEVAKQLGTSYLEIGFDPWGQNLYQIFPAPWGRGSVDMPNPIIYRLYQRVAPEGRVLPGTTLADQTDAYVTKNEDNDDIGFPAGRNPGVAFIYSYGANLISGQLIYRNVVTEGLLQYPEQDLEFWGGGDDINNWDPSFTWQRFYS
ncbi:MAG TPA: type II secretion system protein [Candidatus Hydrogenedentes bacterium]|nr:type II secretion system protein [Candidatus Hydrogenedentota bacterium]HNT86266.1 type II secretion system protein [Candidatus Hydrogenedentota bacterium]